MATEKKVILITGYPPHPGEASNPSLDLAEALDGREYKDYVFRHVAIPIRRSACVQTMEQAIDHLKPDIVIATGLAPGRYSIAIERVGINVTDFPIPDEDGYISLNEPIDPDGPAAYFSTLPIRAMTKAVRKAGLPAYVSNTAGTFCCNLLLYGTLDYISKQNLNIRMGMIHVPFAPNQIENDYRATPSMSLENMIAGVEAAAKAAIDNENDIEMICGYTN